ncbi:MAG: hypothetical protein HW412_2172 [Bacteroidetes bacterium]|nr:hypothetical protein [Bacteroidota bacterium]
MLTPGRTYVIVLSGGLLWCALILLAPVFASLGGFLVFAGDVLYRFFHGICHQLDDRSFHIFGKPLAVCIRCLSIYAGFLAGTLVFPFVKRFVHTIFSKRAVLLWSLVPTVVDVALDALGILDSTTSSRLITGTMFGTVVVFFIIPAAQEAMHELAAGVRPFLRHESKKGFLHA